MSLSWKIFLRPASLYAGLVDKPGGSLVVTTLNLLASPDGGSNRRDGLIDRVLFSEIVGANPAAGLPFSRFNHRRQTISAKSRPFTFSISIRVVLPNKKFRGLNFRVGWQNLPELLNLLTE